MEEFMSELPFDLVLFACGVLGWSLSRWASLHFSVRQNPSSSKLCTIDFEDSGENASSDTCAAELPCASLVDSSPASTPLKRLSSAARRRLSRRAGTEIAVRESAVGVAKEVEPAEKDELKEADKVNFDDSAISATTFDDDSSQYAEPEDDVRSAASLEQDLASATNHAGEESSVSDSEATAESPSVEQGSSAPTPAAMDKAASDNSADVQPPSSVCLDDVQDAQPVEAVVSERVAKMLAKKAERKARRAEERKLLEEQLAAEMAKEIEVESKEGQESKADCQEEEETTKVPQADKTCTKWWVDLIEATLDSDEEELDEDVCGAATWPGPDSPPQWPESAEVQVEWEAADEWMLPLEEMSVPCRETSFEGCEGAAVQALDPNLHAYQPIISEDGQQLYTDGQQVYMMAAMVVDVGAPMDEVTAAATQVITPVVDPCDPLHQAFMCAVASLGSQSPSSMGSSMSWPASPDNAFHYDEDCEARPCAMVDEKEEEEEQDEDALWGVCWDLVK